MGRAFKDLFCQQRRCPESEYTERAFQECLYGHARFLAPLLRRRSPKLFAPDLRFIEHLGHARGMREAKADMQDFDDVNRGPTSFLRRTLKLRVSGRKAMRMAGHIFHEERSAHGESARKPSSDQAVSL